MKVWIHQSIHKSCRVIKESESALVNAVGDLILPKPMRQNFDQ